MCPDMILFYAESRVSAHKILPTTAPEIIERLTRIFESLEKEYGVIMEAESIRNLTPGVLQKWFNAGDKRWKPATLNNYVCVLRPFLQWAAVMEYAPKDFSPVLHTVSLPDPNKLPPDQRPRDKYASNEQMQALLSRNAGHNVVRDRAIMALILYSSRRVSEVCSLTVGQIRERENGSVWVRRKGGAIVETAIGDEAYRLIDAYLATRPNAKPEEALFLTVHGAPCNRTQIWKALSKKQKALGLATGPHALRHVCLSGLEKTASASIARDAANHRSFAVTNRYVHTSIAERRAALNALPYAE